MLQGHLCPRYPSRRNCEGLFVAPATTVANNLQEDTKWYRMLKCWRQWPNYGGFLLNRIKLYIEWLLKSTVKSYKRKMFKKNTKVLIM